MQNRYAGPDSPLGAGFFSNVEKESAYREEPWKTGNHFSIPELGMALMRAKHLTRRGKRGSFEYIQKYPFVKEEPTVPPKKKKKKA